MKYRSKILLAALLFIVTAKTQIHVQTNAERAAQKQQQEQDAQLFADEKILHNYFSENKINAKKTISGLFYTIIEPSDGPKVKIGDIVSMRYTGKFIDGSVFDSNIDPPGDAISVQTGSGRLIRGMDEGARLLKKGGKAMLYIPSGLAYGPQARGSIPANSILIFYIEITDVQKGPKM